MLCYMHLRDFVGSTFVQYVQCSETIRHRRDDIWTRILRIIGIVCSCTWASWSVCCVWRASLLTCQGKVRKLKSSSLSGKVHAPHAWLSSMRPAIFFSISNTPVSTPRRRIKVTRRPCSRGHHLHRISGSSSWRRVSIYAGMQIWFWHVIWIYVHRASCQNTFLLQTYLLGLW